jgi:transcriptional regulator of acetoin/glycerol metabolism
MLLKAAALSTGDIITRDLLPAALFAGGTGDGGDTIDIMQDYTKSLQDIEKAHIAKVLETTNWHRGHACEILGVSRPRLRRLMHHYGLGDS